MRLLLFLSLIAGADAFRLSVPRVLLPYHPENQVKFLLEVTDPEGGCFTWRSSRTDIASVEVMNSSAIGCSDKAIITSRSRFPNEETAVVFAENQGISLTCDVTVDVISSIMITTTTKVLFVDAAPALLIIEAFNKDDDRFSTLGNIPFDWFFTFNEGRPLHIVPFSQSTYKMPFSQSKYDSTPEIEELERQKMKGYAVLVEGISTGSAQLSAKFHEEHFNYISANTIDLFVLANVMLVPSCDLYLPLHAVVKYGAVITQKGRKENLKLPMNEYHLKLSNESVCSLDVETSTVTTKSIGSSEISLIDTHMKPKSGIKPRSAHIFVVEPDSIRFTIDRGNSWFLQLNAEYQISVKLSDPLGNSIHIPDNAVFSTMIPETYFKILGKSKNGTHFRVQTKKTGKLSIKSSFISLTGKHGKEKKLSSVVTGEQQLEILTPISIVPNVILFPYIPKHHYHLQLKATGGSGIYYWRTNDQSVATVGENNGLMKSGKIGEATITAHDAYNSLNLATASVITIY